MSCSILRDFPRKNSSYGHESLKLEVREIPVKSIRHATLSFHPIARCTMPIGTDAIFHSPAHAARTQHKVGILLPYIMGAAAYDIPQKQRSRE